MAQTYTTKGKRENVNNDRMSEAIVSEVTKQRHEQGQKSFGEYEEAPGGGTPGKKGGRGSMGGDFEVVNSKEEAEAIKREDPDAVIRYNQPRDENGQFTYNSANGKGISTKNSRGHTPVPFLAGVDLTFIKKGSTFQYEEVEIKRDKDGNPIKDEKGNEVTEERLVRVISSIDMTADELATACRKYFEHAGGFLGVIKTAVTKKGSPSKIEQTGVTGKTGEIDLPSKALSTQQAVATAGRRKNTAGLQEEAAARKAAFSKWLKKKEAKAAGAVSTPSSSTSTVGAGAGTGASSTTTTPEPETVSKTVETISDSGKPKLSTERAQKFLDVVNSLGGSFGELEVDDIVDMYNSGELTEEDFAELGIL